MKRLLLLAALAGCGASDGGDAGHAFQPCITDPGLSVRVTAACPVASCEGWEALLTFQFPGGTGGFYEVDAIWRLGTETFTRAWPIPTKPGTGTARFLGDGTGPAGETYEVEGSADFTVDPERCVQVSFTATQVVADGGPGGADGGP